MGLDQDGRNQTEERGWFWDSGSLVGILHPDCGSVSSSRKRIINAGRRWAGGPGRGTLLTGIRKPICVHEVHVWLLPEGSMSHPSEQCPKRLVTCFLITPACGGLRDLFSVLENLPFLKYFSPGKRSFETKARKFCHNPQSQSREENINYNLRENSL